MDQILYLGVKGHVSAISKRDGHRLWTTKLPSGFSASGDGFVTLLVDGARVYAHSYGELHCLEAATGAVLWRNPLEGLGFGIASLAIAGAANSPAAVKRNADSQTSDAT